MSRPTPERSTWTASLAPVLLAPALLTLTWVALPGAAWANAVEDMFAVGARTKSMGGAGTALSNDYGAVFHNPAGLAFCPANSVSLAYDLVATQLEVSDDDPHEALDPQPMRHAVAIGFCVQLPFEFAFGMHFSMNLARPMALDQQSIESQPNFFKYGKRLDAFSIMVALAWETPLPGLSIGAGAAVLANSTINLSNDVPVVTSTAVRNDFRWNMDPTAAVYGGIWFEVIPQLTLGAVYRSPLYHALNVDAATRVEAAGVLLDVDLILQGQMWYSPQQLAFGATFRPNSQWTFAADVTWHNWSSYSGPFIVASPNPYSDVAKTLIYPPREPINFSDTVVPRVGGEYLYDNMIAVRLGYSYKMTPAPIPYGIANLLDSDTQYFSVGAGYYWIPDQPAADSDEEPFPLAAIKVDAYFTLAFIHQRSVDKSGSQPTLNDYSFGGFALNAGLTATVEY